MYNISLFLGAYTPVTLEENIVIDGVSASCYAFSNHDLAHLVTTPIRWVPELIKETMLFPRNSPSLVFVRIH